MSLQAPLAPSSAERWLARALQPFAKVEADEACSALLLALAVFLLLTAYYLLKTAREPLILLHGGAEVKSYAAAGQAILLLGVVKAYAAVARRVGRMKLLAAVYLFFAANLLLFALLARTNRAIGVPFYLWVGVFNSTAIAQFWAFAADVYTPGQGKRLFAVLGIGSSTGAIVGARIARAVVHRGPAFMMLTAAFLLVVCVIVFSRVDGSAQGALAGSPDEVDEQPLATEGAFRLVSRDKYLLLIAALMLLLNCCNSTGEYLLDRTLLASVSEAQTRGLSPAEFVAAFKADYFAWVNLSGVLLQLFVVSRVLSKLGVKAALLVLPVVAFAAYAIVLVSPVLSLIRAAKIAENSVDYSLQSTASQSLYLAASRSEKYLGKTLVDTFMVRMGDVVSAAIVGCGTLLGLHTSQFAMLNLVLVVVWIGVVTAITREHARRLGVVPASVAPAAVGA